METYNGFTNRGTWLVMLWIDNHYKNYVTMVRFVNGIGTRKKLENYTNDEILAKIKTLHYGDDIIWDNVDINDIRELLEEYKGIRI